MSNDLIYPEDLAHLPGAPFDQAEVDEAVAALRAQLGWHIAPERDETITLDVACAEPVLRLPTRHLVSVDEIRNAITTDVIVASTYRVSLALCRVRRASFWPAGYGAVEVDMTHGFETCPPALRPIIAMMIESVRADPSVTQETLGSWSRTFGDRGMPDAQQEVLAQLSVRNSWPARLA